jgi:hypothetical protein
LLQLLVREGNALENVHGRCIHALKLGRHAAQRRAQRLNCPGFGASIATNLNEPQRVSSVLVRFNSGFKMGDMSMRP